MNMDVYHQKFILNFLGYRDSSSTTTRESITVLHRVQVHLSQGSGALLLQRAALFGDVLVLCLVVGARDVAGVLARRPAVPVHKSKSIGKATDKKNVWQSRYELMIATA